MSLPGTAEDIKWGDHLCFSVGTKMYLVTSPDLVPSSASFKVPEEDYEQILAKPGFHKHSHLARYFWVHLEDITLLGKKEWENYIKQSYMLVASKLSNCGNTWG